jgi:hypothetical protein
VQRYDFDDNTWKADGEAKTKFYLAAYEQPIEDYQPKKIEDGFVFHWSLNRLSDGKFGNPPIMRILDWTRAYNEFMRARVSLMRALAMFAWQRKVKGSPSDVRKIANAWANGQLASGGVPGEGAGVPNQYAATVSTNENVQWEQLKTDTGGAAAREDGRMIKGQVAVGGGFPMHYLGDIGGANLATATAMELPVQKMVEGIQGYIEGQLYRMIDFAIIAKIRAGELEPTKAGRFSAERLKLQGKGIEDMTEAEKAKLEEAEDVANGKVTGDDTTVDGKHKTVEGHNDRGEYNYKIVMPAVLKRQVSETINAVINLIKAVDPYGQNVEGSRWVLKHALEILDEPNPQSIVDTIFPAGFEYPTNIEAERGRTDTREGDGSGQVDFQAARKPPATSRVGVKGGKEARPAEEAMEAAEGAFLDLIDTMTAHIEGAKDGSATDSGDGASTEG